MSSMALKNYNKLLTSGRCSNKYPKDVQILSLVVVIQKLSDEANKSSEKSTTSNRESTKGEPDYIMYLPPCMLEDPKSGVGNKTKYGK